MSARSAAYNVQTEIDGLSGKIILDENGERTSFDLDVIQLEKKWICTGN